MSLAAYAQYWRFNFLTMVEYRANFIMWFVFTIIYHATAIFALWVTLTRFPSMNGWDFREMAFLYALWMLAHEIHNTLFGNVRSVPEYIREGRFDRFLVRPLSPLFSLITVPTQVSIDGIFIALVTFIGATIYSGVHVDVTFLIAVPLIIAGGALIDFGIALAIATVAFWTVRTDALQWAVMSLEQEFTRYPISIYSHAVRIALVFVFPFAFMNYFPATFLLHKSETALALSPAVGLLTPLIGLAWFGAAYAFWNFGLRYHKGTGS